MRNSNLRDKRIENYIKNFMKSFSYFKNSVEKFKKSKFMQRPKF